MKTPLKVILDTNFLMIPFQFRVDIFDEINRLLPMKYTLFVPRSVLLELKTLSRKGKLREKKAASIGLDLTENIERLEVQGSDTDKAILDVVDRWTVICTNDKELKKKVLEKGGRVIFLRKKSYLQMEGGEFGLS